MNKVALSILTPIILIALSLLLIPVGNSINNSIYDSFTGDINNKEIDDVVVISIDDNSFKELNRRWPWSRTWLAEVVTKLDKAGVGAIGIDISLFDAGFNQKEDEDLANALKKAGNVTLISRWIKNESGINELYEPLNIFRTNSETGYGNLIGDEDGVIRRYDYLTAPQDDVDLIMQSFAYSLYMTWLDGEYPPEGNDDPFLDFYTIDGEPKPVEEFGLKGNRYIDYRNMGTLDIPYISFSNVLNDNFDSKELKGKVVLIGAKFPESHDQYAASGTSHELIYGVDLHAHAVAGLIKGEFPSIPNLNQNLLTLFITILVVTLIVLLLKFVPGIISLLFLVASTFGVQYFIWNNSDRLISFGFILLPIIPGVIIFTIWHFFVENRARKRIRGQFSRFVAPAVVNQIVSNQESPKLGGERKHVTVLFSDIVSFTTMSEEMEPEQMVSMLNRYFTLMVDVIFKHEGTINKFIGDAIMAVFGAPITQEDSEERAVLAAIDMAEALEKFNEDQRKRGEREFGTGIGINSGPVVVGNVGSERQMEYTVIGDTVNLSARLEGLTRKYGQIVISDNVYQKVKDMINVETPESVMVKGKSNLIDIHVVKGRKK